MRLANSEKLTDLARFNWGERNVTDLRVQYIQYADEDNNGKCRLLYVNGCLLNTNPVCYQSRKGAPTSGCWLDTY